MEYRTQGKILRGVGGLWLVELAEDSSPLGGKIVACRAQGKLHTSDRKKLLVGDLVEITYTNASFSAAPDGTVTPADDSSGLPGAAVCALLPRRNELIRPPMANLDLLFVACAAAAPAPSPATIDKVLSVAEYHSIEPAIIIGKCELDREKTAELVRAYTLAGYPVFPLSCATGEGIGAVAAYIHEKLPGHSAAFAGASGVGKSTLLNTLFPSLGLESGEISRKIERGRHTTRRVELFRLENGGYLADTPGFSLIDFENFDFFPFDALLGTMREFDPYLGECRYADCTHTKEEGCAVLRAVAEGKIASSRHDSYLEMYGILKNKHPWDKKSEK